MIEPGDEITYAEAMEIIGRSDTYIRDLARQGVFTRQGKTVDMRLSRTEIEAYAVEHWTRRRHRKGGYWMMTGEVAELLGRPRPSIWRLADHGRLPTLRTLRGEYLYRRPQMQAIANAQDPRLGHEFYRVEIDFAPPPSP